MPSNKQTAKEIKDAKFIKYVYPLRQVHIGDLVEQVQNNVKRYIKENDIDLNDVRELNEPIVFFAIRNYAPALLKLFVENGASLDVVDNKGASPLTFAEEVVEETLDNYSKSSQHYLLAESAVEYLKSLVV